MSRKSKFRITDYLQHILDAIARVDSYILEKSAKKFSESFLIREAAIRNLEVIGEAAINIRSTEPAAAKGYPEWDQICAMCNRLTHGYFDINVDVVWRTAQVNIQPLRQYIQTIMKTHD